MHFAQIFRHEWIKKEPAYFISHFASSCKRQIGICIASNCTGGRGFQSLIVSFDVSLLAFSYATLQAKSLAQIKVFFAVKQK